ncbi:hypothetical protein Q5P01_018660 [Channa striata]|uniref:C-type lectin domain-containing protein n=1 Tax=Channa striata TaxID=64152 RepID=A0AA88M583_CHASR|nr:hypothetical protein Q5P01_018660 [Channa striata]
MPEAEVLYSDVMFTKLRGNTEEINSSSTETTYSEVKTWKTQQPVSVSLICSAASQEVESNKRSKVTSDRVPLLVLSVLLTAAVIALAIVSFYSLHIKKLHDALRRNITDEPCLKCEEGWEHHGPMCYYFSIVSSPWIQSREECRHRGGDLVQIDSREEQTFLEEKLREKMNEAEDKFWIGLTDSVKEGRWLWVDGSELNTSLTFWSKNEPDDWKGENGINPDGEDCVRMGEKTGAADLKCWFDKLCAVPQRSICEKAAMTRCHLCQDS